MERLANWYSVIRYSPDILRGEILNIGIIVNNVETKELHFQFLKHSNTKLKSLLITQSSLELYKAHSDYITFYLEQVIKRDSIFVNATEHHIFNHLKEIVPSEIMFSEPTFALTGDSHALLNSLMATYIGEEYLVESEITQSKIRQYVRQVFNDKHLLDYKVKANAKIYPIKDKQSISYNVDFVYKNGMVNLMQAAPSKDNMHNWFNKLNTFIDNYSSETVYHVLLNTDVNEIKDQTFKEMVEYLTERAPENKFHLIDINSNKFEELCKKIEVSGQLLESFQDDLNNVI